MTRKARRNSNQGVMTTQQEQELTPIKDHFGRLLKDLRTSVIDQCNVRCNYCMPKEIFGKDYAVLPKSELLSFDEIVRLAETFAELGVDKIRITGGEPLMRKNLDQLIRSEEHTSELQSRGHLVCRL